MAELEAALITAKLDALLHQLKLIKYGNFSFNFSQKLFKILLKKLKHIIIIILAKTTEIEQCLVRLLSCRAREPEQSQKDLQIIVDSELASFFMTYKYILTVVSKLRKTFYRRTNTGMRGQRSSSYTTANSFL